MLLRLRTTAQAPPNLRRGRPRALAPPGGAPRRLPPGRAAAFKGAPGDSLDSSQYISYVLSADGLPVEGPPPPAEEPEPRDPIVQSAVEDVQQ